MYLISLCQRSLLYTCALKAALLGVDRNVETRVFSVVCFM